MTGMRANTLRAFRAALHRPPSRPFLRWNASSAGGGRQWSTPLAKSLAETITTTGPISVAAYMRQCLTSLDGGYYTRQPDAGTDPFGAKGDFVTSPEISQVFGELVGLWLYTEWLAQGQSNKLHIIEVGPGRGTLMSDVLRALSSFKRFTRGLDAIYLVEASPHLRTQQAELLSSTGVLEDTDIGWTAPCKLIPDCKLVWCEDIRFVPKEETSTPFILAHEFFDALPIHVFQTVAESSLPASSVIHTPTGPITPKRGVHAPKNQWHELMVAPDSSQDTPTTSNSLSAGKGENPAPDFHLTVSKTPTPHSLYLPQSSSRYKKLENTADAIIEISPESQTYISDFAVRIGGSNSKTTSPASSKPSVDSMKESSFSKPQPSGAALILDYGPSDTIPANTLRGIRSHKPCSPFVSPGLVDLSADVDFLALAESALDASPAVEVHGPVEQSFFLSTMGIKQRAEQLLKNAKDEETKQRLDKGWKRLVDRGPSGMGRIYKAMALLPYKETGAVRRPVGFGGNVVG